MLTNVLIYGIIITVKKTRQQKAGMTMKKRIGDETLDYITEHNENPLDFMYAIMHEADLTDEEALCYLCNAFDYKYSVEELKEIIAEYNNQQGRTERSANTYEEGR